MRAHAAWPLVALLVVGLALEYVWVRLYLLPFSLVRLDGPQLSPEPFVPVLEPGGRGLGVFLLSLVLLFGLYFVALALVRFVPSRRLLPIAAGFGVLFALMLWPTIALGSTDLYHYILDGRALVLHGGNPLATPPQDFWNDRLAYILFYNTENTGAYGPLFYTLAAVAALVGGDDLVWSTIALKGLALLWLLGCLPLVYLVAERLQTGRGAAALLAFAWNPLVLFEAVGSGHNDIGVAFFGLLTVWVALSGRPRLAPAALALGVLVKPTAVLMLPPLAVWLWFGQGGLSRKQLALAFGAAAALIVVAYLPFWAGGETFSELQRMTGRRINSPADLAIVLLSERFTSDRAVRLVKVLGGAAFFAASAAVLVRAARRPGRVVLVSAIFWCLFAYVMLASWWFWPWYLLPLAAFGSVLWPGRAGSLAAVFSCTGLLLYAALGWRETLFTYSNTASQAFGTALIVFLAPALLWVSGWWGGASLEREP